MKKYILLITPIAYNKLFKVKLTDMLNDKTFDDIHYNVLPFKGFSISGISIKVELTTNKSIDELKTIKILNEIFKEDVLFDEMLTYKCKKSSYVLTLVE